MLANDARRRIISRGTVTPPADGVADTTSADRPSNGRSSSNQISRICKKRAEAARLSPTLET
jgi:hypothetical protein